MGQSKNLTIGVTINLDNYENLRLEVDGEVCTDRDAEDLVVFLDGMIARLGRGDPATAERLDAYRRRVFDLPAGASDAPVPPAQAEITLSEPPEAPVISGVVEAGPAVAAPAPAVEEAPVKAPMKPVTAGPAPMVAGEKASPATSPAPSDQVSTPPSGEEVCCEECGVVVTDAQAKVSQMFMGRTLCKKCMPGV